MSSGSNKSSSAGHYGSLATSSTSNEPPVVTASVPSRRRTMENGRQLTSKREEAQPLLTEANDVHSDGEGSTLSHEEQGRSKRPSSSPSSAIENGTTANNSGDVVRLPLPSSDDEEVAVADGSHDPHSISNCDAIIHLLKGNIGTGILAMPDAIKNSGLLVGNVGLVFLSVFCVTCMHMLVGCAGELCKRTRVEKMDYAQVAEAAFSTSGPRTRRFAVIARRTTNVFLCITQLGFCCVYFVFVAQNMKLVFDHHFGEVNYHAYMGIVLLPMLLLCSIRNLRYLAPVSMLANVLQFAGLVLTFFYLLQDLPKTWERKAFASWGQLPLYFGTAIYAFEGIGVILPIENQMRYKSDLRGLNGVLNTSMVIVTCLYIAVAFFGYLKYGEGVQGSITLNLPVEEWLAQIVIFAMSLAIFFSYGLQFYVPVKIILPFILSRTPEHHHRLAEYMLRYGLVIFTFALAAAIPRLDLFISLVGAVSSSTLALMAPPILDTVTFWPNMGFAKIRLMRNVFLFTIGFVGFLTGSYVSISNIITFFRTGQ